MAFQIKDFASITASTINWMRSVTRKVTDFNVGSVVRTMLEAVSAEIEELYQQAFIGLREAIAVAVYNSFSFFRQSSVTASGLVRVVIDVSASDTTIVAGTKFTPNVGTVGFIASADVVIPAGSTLGDVPVVATVAGSAGNVAAGTTFALAPNPSGFVSATSQRALINGRDDESDEQRRLRFNEFIASLNRGTIRAIEYGVTEFAKLYDADDRLIEQVAKVHLVEPYLLDPENNPVGLVYVYIHNGVGSTSGALITKTSQVIHGYVGDDGVKVPGWKAAGVRVNVYAATEQLLNVAGELTPLPGYAHDELVDEAISAITRYLLELPIGDAAILAEIVSRVMDIEGVYNFIMTLPVADVDPDETVKVIPGVIAIYSRIITPGVGAIQVGGSLADRTP